MHDSKIQDGARYNIANAVLHPKFVNLTIYDDYDLALITVNKKIEFGRNVRPICLPSAIQEFSDHTAIVAGWGARREGSHSLGMGLQEVKIKVKRNEECSRDLKKILTFNDESMICGYEYHKDACQVRQTCYFETLNDSKFFIF